MKFLNGQQPQYELTFNDVFMVPSYSDIRSRMDVSLTTPDNIGTTIPIIVANMNAVSGRRMAETVARRGGMAILPQDIPVEELKKSIEYVKSRHLVYETPLTLGPQDCIADALGLIHKRSHGAVIIIDKAGKPIGIFTEADAKDNDRFTQLQYVMTPKPKTVNHTDSLEKMYSILDKNLIKVAPVINKSGKLLGAVTKQGVLRSQIFSPAVDAKEQLQVGVAIGINGDVASKASQALDFGADVLVLDTAHGHQLKMIQAIKAVKRLKPTVQIVAGNVATAKATSDLIEAGADIVKVGIGPGAMCTTRMMTGVGRPQFSAVLECAHAAKQAKKQVWADGGVRYPRDVALALAAGASNVMIGSWFAGTFESVSDVYNDENGRLYKENYGMASKRAVLSRTSEEARFSAAQKELFEEGISKSRMYIDNERPGVEDNIDQIVAGLRSSMTYAGAKNIDEFYKKAVIGIQSAAGFLEGRAVSSSWD